MLSAERRLKIAKIVSENKGIKTSELSNMFDVSEMTVLRDLANLESQGLLKRVYGGALSVNNHSGETSSMLREKINVKEKEYIAGKAINIIKNGDTIFLDSSTTSLTLAKRLFLKENLTVITNNLEVINVLKDNADIKLICLGGMLSTITMSFYGSETENYLKSLNADIGFISSAGISTKAGITVENSFQSVIKRLMALKSLNSVLIIDSSKFGKIKLSSICPFMEIDTVITDSKPGKEYIEAFKENNINLIY